MQAAIGEGVPGERPKPDEMSDHQASRTLVKSAPELWAQCSNAASLARHLGAFGEIRITKLEPETAVVWEGDAARGTVRLEPSGWGTRVVLTAGRAEPASPPAAEPERPSRPEVIAAPHRRRWSRVRLRWPRREPPGAPADHDPVPPASPADREREPGTTPATGDCTGLATPDVLDAALQSLGAAHHRPYSRS